MAFTLLAAASLTSSIVYANHSESSQITASAVVPSSCTMSGQGTSSHSTNTLSGTYTPDIGTTTINVICNDPSGFSIYATGYTGGVIGQENSNKLIGANTGSTIATGTATSAGVVDISNWAMKLATDSSAAYEMTLSDNYDDYHEVPNYYTKVATRTATTDIGPGAVGSTLTTTYATYISKTQPADTYTGQVKYILIDPSTAPDPEPCPDDNPCIRIVSAPFGDDYELGDKITPDKLKVVLYDSDGTPQKTIPTSELEVSPSIVSEEFISYTNANGVRARMFPLYEQTLYAPDGAAWTGVASREGWPNDNVDDHGNHGHMHFSTYGGGVSGNYYFTKYGGRIYALHDGEPVGAIVSVQCVWTSYYKFWYWYGAMSTGQTTNTFSSTMFNEGGTYDFSTIPESATDPRGVGLDSLTQKEMTVTVSYHDQSTGETYTTSYIVTVR